jgi:integrase
LDNNHVKNSDNENLTVDDIALEALNQGRGDRNLATHTDILSIYEKQIKPYLGDRYLSDIKISDIKTWKYNTLSRKSLSKARYVKYHRTLNFIFQHALENDLVTKNVVDLVDRKSKLFTKTKKSEKDQYYTSTEVERMLNTATGFFRVMLATVLNLGCRTGELLALQWDDIDFEAKTITIQRSMRSGVLNDSTKTGKDRVIIVSKPLKEILLDYKEVAPDKTWLFINPYTGKPFTSSKAIIKRYLKPLLEECKIKYKTFYALRHSFASISAQKGIPMSFISKQLGHADIAVTMKYYVKHNLLDSANDLDIFDKIYA